MSGPGFDVDAATILRVVHGSRAYGTNTSTSDTDIKGVCIQPIDHQLGFLHLFEQREQLVSKGHSSDETIFNLKKFASLAANCNPNVLELLYVDPSDIIMMTPEGEMLRDARSLFLSKQAKHTFSGYAHAQLKRIRSHRAWLLNPPKAPPVRADFGLSGERGVGKDVLGAFDALTDRSIEVPTDVQARLVREKQYAAAKMHWDQYQNWVATRNPARAALEARYGFDTKHGMHLIRLLTMGCEILAGKGVIVRRRDDAEFLLAIRNGFLSYDSLIEYAEALDKYCSAVYTVSKLPDASDRVRINDLVVEITLQHAYK